VIAECVANITPRPVVDTKNVAPLPPDLTLAAPGKAPAHLTEVRTAIEAIVNGDAKTNADSARSLPSAESAYRVN
jgi:hypothetical protein